MALISMYGEMWTRNTKNINAIPAGEQGGVGVYILYDGSMPLYMGKGNLKHRISGAHKSKRRGKQWNYFSWYAIPKSDLRHDVEVMLLRMLPFYLRIFNRQRGKFLPTARKHHEEDLNPIKVSKIWALGRKS